MSSAVMTAAGSLRDALAGVDVALLSGADCAVLAEELARTEKVCATVRLLAASRAVKAGAHRERGFGDGAAWVARQSGSTGAAARRELETAARLGGCPDTKAALVAGDISIAQADEIVRAEAQTPGAERALLADAARSDLSGLRERAREHRQARVDPGELRARQFATREFRSWSDRDGMLHFAGALPPERGLPLVQRIELAAGQALRSARASGGGVDRFPAYAADALVDLVAGAGPRDGAHPGSQPRARAELVLVCDLYAFRRGHTHPGEVCHIVGGGPIPVDVLAELAADAFLKVVLHDGVTIHTVEHFGRHLPAAVRTALDLGPVPAFTGRQCVDCGRRFGLEYDHIDPLAHHGPTSYANLAARCWADHQAKTDRDRAAGLLGSAPVRAPSDRRRGSPESSASGTIT